MKLSEMGTTGLVEYVNSASNDREWRSRMGRAKGVIRARYGERAVERFRTAVYGFAGAR